MSKMSTFAELTEQAVKLGLSEEAVAQFALQQQAFQRKERAQEREREREEREDRAKEQEQEREREREERERDEREKEREFELAKLNLTFESGARPTQCPDAGVRGPKLPAYQEGEDIAAYLTRFDRIATLLTIDEESLAVRLGSLLTGKAAELYSTFSTDTISDFPLLKKALLTSFDKTPERYRLDFRNCKIRVGENYHQMNIRLQ
ncbi:hypothetical protein E2C01_100676 [Portunus trituberculatus]|uniref:Retrotransposon gag domain-containing protein n=1 Tax=Portunus trituberculatus TaxID=210409 RepID=A0A5B7K7I6_PORTR|nr:hypothetical protein [Portunus trituberculatus]